jgi:hypothetical protein
MNDPSLCWAVAQGGGIAYCSYLGCMIIKNAKKCELLKQQLVLSELCGRRFLHTIYTSEYYIS